MEAGTTVQITMPQMGESVTEGTILEWLKQVGDEVEAEEGIVEVSTDKVDAEVPAPAAGILTKILVEPDETVPVGTVLGEISPNGASGNGGAPEREAAGSSVETPEHEAADESSVEAAEHGAAAEEEHQTAKEEVPEEAEVVEVKIPEMGESVAEGTILEWLGEGRDPARGRPGLVGGSSHKVGAERPPPVEGPGG